MVAQIDCEVKHERFAELGKTNMLVNGDMSPDCAAYEQRRNMTALQVCAVDAEGRISCASRSGSWS